MSCSSQISLVPSPSTLFGCPISAAVVHVALRANRHVRISHSPTSCPALTAHSPPLTTLYVNLLMEMFMQNVTHLNRQAYGQGKRDGRHI